MDSASSSPPADVGRRPAVALAAIGLFLLSWAVLHTGFWDNLEIIDTPVYEEYGDAIVNGEVPYRDFEVEYPPGALPAFAVPALDDDYRRGFGWLMAACGAVAVALAAAVLAAVEASERRFVAALVFIGVAPLALGTVVLTRFDLWPTAVMLAALAALVTGRHRLGCGALALAVAIKIFPVVLAPLAAAWVARRRGRREAVVCAGIFVGVVVACFAPFLVVAPEGVAASIGRQLSRPLQIESLGASFLIASHHLFGTGVEMRASHGSQNIAGAPAAVVAVATSVVQVAALAWIWLRFARERRPDAEVLVGAAAAALVAFVVLGKVLSPQFLIWLVPVVPLVRGRRGLGASALLAAALVLTQLWFPFRYWDLATEFDEVPSWLVFVRDLVLVALLAVLVWPVRRLRRAAPRTP